MPKVECWFKQDLKKPVKVQTLNGNVFTLDNVGSLIGVEVYDNGSPATLSGSANGYIILPDDTTVSVAGTRSGNKVSINLPQSALAIPGFIKIAVKLTNSSEITTLLGVVATVYKSRTDTIITPSQQIITDWSQQIAAEMQAVEDASAAQDAKIDDLKSALITKFNTIKINSVGVQNIYVNAGDTLLVDVHSNTVSTNLFVQPYLAGDTILNIPANVTNRQYTFVAGKEGYICLQSTSTVIDADVTYKSALSQDVDALSQDVDALSQDVGIKNVANIETGHYLIATRIGQTVSVSGATQNWAYTPTPTFVKAGLKVIVSTRGSSMCVLAVSSDDNIANATAAIIGNNDSAITDYEYTLNNDMYIWVSGRVNETSAKIIYNNSVYKMAEEALSKATSLDEDLNGIEFKTPNTSNILYVHTGDKIIIDVSSNTIASNFMILPYAAGDPYIQIPVGTSKTVFTAYKDGYIAIQGTGTVIDAMIYTSRFDFKIDELEEQINEGVKTYTVKKDGTGDFQSFTAALRSLENDETEKILYVYPGVYDIYEELGGDAYIATIDPSTANWRDVQPVVPPNTSVIGRGNVELRFAPTASQIGSTQMAFLFSPLNISGNCHIENLSVYGTNCRYAIHDESSGMSKYDDTVHIYKNVRARKDHGTYGNAQVFGSGLGARCRWTFDSCEFTSDMSGIWTVHTTTSVASDMASVIFNNCVFKMDNTDDANAIIQFITGPSGHAATKNIAMMNSCFIAGSIHLTTDSVNQVTQKYDFRSLKSTITGGVVVSSNFTSNPYPPKVYT